ncbi:hypothetical protein [Rhizobium sp. 007]|uniref:hypothetical protein n=1 Tax=Rhizobium sp. 007 TaxID=2785056 RepID=UPI001FEE1B9B|nr:hypothetical protein [Rhizobium sp. 007]
MASAFALILGTEIDEQFVESRAAGLRASLLFVGLTDQGTDFQGARTGHEYGNKVKRIAYLGE